MDRFYFPIFLFSAVLAVGWIWYWGADPLWGEQYEALNQESSVESAKRRGALAYEQKDWATVVRILQKPALEGDMESQYLLGGLYWEGGRNLPKDPENILVQGVVPSMTGGINQRPTAYFKNIHRKSSARGSRKVHGGPSPLPNGRLFADNDGQIRIAVGNEYDSYSSRVMYRHDMKSVWSDISARLGGDQDDNITVVSASQNNQSFYFLSRLGGDTRALWRIDESLENPELIHRDPEVDVQMELFEYRQSAIPADRIAQRT